MPVGDYSELEDFRGDLPEPAPVQSRTRVTSLNGLTGAVRLVDENGDEFDTSGQTIEIPASGGSADIDITNEVFADSGTPGGTAPSHDGSLGKPFSTLNEGLAAAEALAAAGTGYVVLRSVGEFAEALLFDQERVIWDGQNATINRPPTTGAVTVNQPNVEIRNVTISRAAGGSAQAVLHMTSVTTLATWLENVVLRNVRVTNPNGTAIDDCSMITYGLIIEDCVTGIERNLGGQHYGQRITASRYGVKDSMSIAENSSQPPENVHWAKFVGGSITVTDTSGGWAIRGSREDPDGTNISHDPNDLAWFPTIVSGGTINGAAVAVGSTGASSPAVLDCVELQGVWVNSDTITTRLYSVRWTGCVLSSQNPDVAAIMTGIYNCVISGGSAVFGTGAANLIELTGNSIMQAINFETDPSVSLAPLTQRHLVNCTAALPTLKVMGWQGAGRAVRFNGNAGTYGEIFGSTRFKYTSGTDMTIELWFRLLDNSQELTGLMSCMTDLGANGWALMCNPNDDILYINVNGNYLSISGQGINDGEWHHARVTFIGTARKLYLDGAHEASDTNAVTGTGSPRLVIGAFSGNPGIHSAGEFSLIGDLKQIRISQGIVRNTGSSFEPQQRYFGDDYDVLLLDGTTDTPARWENKAGFEHVDLYPSSVSSNPIWIHEDDD